MKINHVGRPKLIAGKPQSHQILIKLDRDTYSKLINHCVKSGIPVNTFLRDQINKLLE